MNLRKFTIKRLFVFTIVLILIALAGFTVVFYLHHTSSQQNAQQQLILENLIQKSLLMQQAKDEFVFRDAHSSSLYVTKSSRSIETMSRLIAQTNQMLQQLENRLSASELKCLNTLLQQYYGSFQQLQRLVIERGFKDYGLEGKLRSTIHTVETSISRSNDHELMSDMLMLRRHEKDYIIRRDTAYINKFTKSVQNTILYIHRRGGTGASENEVLLRSYNDLFVQYAQIDALIGRNEDEGALKEVNQNYIAYSTKLGELIENTSQQISLTSNRTFFSFMVLLIAASVSILFILTYINRHIARTIYHLQSAIQQLGKGELPVPIEVSGNDEFASMERSINELTIALRNTRDFAIEVGNGNFSSEVNVFGNTGELGSCLLDMRKKLMEVAEQQERSISETRERNWLNESLARADELLRIKYESVETLCFVLLNTSIKTINAQQGGIFLLNSNDDMLNLAATYAMNRRKYITKSLYKYEGLVGSCIFEKDVVYITDIPKDYMHLTTGLGEMKPRCIAVIPLLSDMNDIIGAMEVASQYEITPVQIEFLRRACRSLATSINFINVVNAKKTNCNTQDSNTSNSLKDEELEIDATDDLQQSPIARQDIILQN